MPAPNVVRFEHADLQIYVDGVEQGQYAITSVDWSAETSVDSSRHIGEVDPHKDTIFNGGRASVSMELRGGRSDPNEFISTFLEGVRSLTNTGRLDFVFGYVDPRTGRRRSIRFGGVHLVSPGGSVGSGQRLTQTIAIESETVQFIL